MFVPAPTEPEEAAVCLSSARNGVLYVNVCGVMAVFISRDNVVEEDESVV